jgi:hypothetical protein
VQHQLERLRPFVECALRFSGWEFRDLQVRHLGVELHDLAELAA